MGRRIRVPEVRVIGADGSQVGILPTHEAMRLAEEQGLELVEVNPRAAPPVCKIMDFGKYKYELQKKANEARKKQKVIEIKEIKIRPTIEEHDYQVKLRAARRFLEEGNKVKMTLRFRGREMSHQNLGMEVLQRMEKDLGDLGKVESPPRMEGRQVQMVMGPQA